MPLCIRHAQGMGLSHTAVRLVEGLGLRGCGARTGLCTCAGVCTGPCAFASMIASMGN